MKQYTNATRVPESHPSWHQNIKYLVVGILFGIVFVKSEVVSWFRIQEMFRLQSFHMYGIIGSAVLVGALSFWLIKKFQVRTFKDRKSVVSGKRVSARVELGGRRINKKKTQKKTII